MKDVLKSLSFKTRTRLDANMCFSKKENKEVSDCSSASASMDDVSVGVDENDGRMDNVCNNPHSYRVIRLKQENEKLRRALICRRCKNTRVQTLNLPCCHIVCCEACADILDNCPLCEERILGTARIFVV